MSFVDLLQQLFDYLVTRGIHDVLPAIGLGFVGYWLAQHLPRLLGRGMTRAYVEPTLTTFVVHVSRYALFIFFTIVVLSRLGIETTSLIAMLGAAGLAIGLALQSSLSNFAAGVLIIVFRPFRVGDLVEVGGATGTVQDIQIFTTVLHTVDNLRIVVPNDLITKGKIINYSANDIRRIDLTVGIAYTQDLEQVRQILTDILVKDPRILAAPAPGVMVAELSKNGMQFVLRAWSKTSDYEAVRSSVLERIKLTFDQHDIAML
jgi:small conductance mechanosensitive channel